MTTAPVGTHGPVQTAGCIAWMGRQSNTPTAGVIGIKMKYCTALMGLLLIGQIDIVRGYKMGFCIAWMVLPLYMPTVPKNGGSMTCVIPKTLGVLQRSRWLN